MKDYENMSEEELELLNFKYIECCDFYKLLNNDYVTKIEYKHLINEPTDSPILLVVLNIMLFKTIVIYVENPYTSFKYTTNFDGNVDIIDSFAVGETLIIPNKINNKQVTTIHGVSCDHLLGVDEIIIESGISYLDVRCFNGGSFGRVVLPDSLVRIGARAFQGCKNICNVTIPNKIECIENNVFENCHYLTIIHIPKSVTRIEEGAFYNCINLGYVYYEGTPEEWKKIDISPSNEILDKCYIYYNKYTTDNMR